jgi:hypothetical protein
MAPPTKVQLIKARSYRLDGINLIPDYKTPGVYHAPGGRVYTERLLGILAAKEVIIHIERRPYMPE